MLDNAECQGDGPEERERTWTVAYRERVYEEKTEGTAGLNCQKLVSGHESLDKIN